MPLLRGVRGDHATRCKLCTAEIEPGVLGDEDAPQITTRTRVAG
ncbi:hypothetical protein [Pseudonocardia humida]|nr:hypothetical protein [Pseudonocardia humida]